jgi:hypothetical protein
LILGVIVGFGIKTNFLYGDREHVPMLVHEKALAPILLRRKSKGVA